MLMHLFFIPLFAPKRRKYALDAQSKIAFVILLVLPQQKTLRNGGLYED